MLELDASTFFFLGRVSPETFGTAFFVVFPPPDDDAGATAVVVVVVVVVIVVVLVVVLAGLVMFVLVVTCFLPCGLARMAGVVVVVVVAEEADARGGLAERTTFLPATCVFPVLAPAAAGGAAVGGFTCGSRL